MPAQPSSSASVQNSQELFRIYQPIESPGDIFEVDSSCKAVFIGQNSDVAEVRLQYFDEQEGPDLMNTVDVSVNGPFVGRMDALLDTTYASLGQKARVLAFPVDLVDNAYVRPTSPLFTPARRFNIPAYIDLMCALSPLPAIPQVRADRTFRYPNVPFNNDEGLEDDGSTDIVIPIYGRRMVTIQLITPPGVGHLTSVLIAALQPGTPSQPKFLGSLAKGAASISDTDSMVFRASDQIDRNAITGTGSTSVPTTFSYTENAGPPLPECKGMADLMIVNIAPLFLPPAPPGYSMIDVFIKVSDRED